MANQAPAVRGPVWGHLYAGGGPYAERYWLCVVSGSCPREDQVPLTEHGYMPHYGVGVEWQMLKSVGVSAEAGFLVWEEYPAGMLSANGSYYFRDARAGERTVVPFVTGGYSFAPEWVHQVNIGGGVDYWLRGGRGFRLEVRHHSAPRVDFPETGFLRFLEFRVGMNFGRSSGTRSAAGR
jgi:hypothetical protein